MKYKVVKEIKSGMSKDKKYVVYLNDMKEYAFLRVGEVSTKKIQDYENIKKIYANIKSGNLIKWDICNNELNAFFKYIPGHLLMDKLKNSSAGEKYQYGILAGELLSNIHKKNIKNININFSNEEFINTILDKYNDFVQKNDIIDLIYKKCLNEINYISFDDYVILNADYHTENMIVSNNELYIVDLEKYEYGDRLRDFSFIYTCGEDKIFAKGLLDGYLVYLKDKKDFFKRFKFYSMISIIQYYIWCYKKYGNSFDSIKIAKEFLYDFNKSELPLWYEKRDDL